MPVFSTPSRLSVVTLIRYTSRERSSAVWTLRGVNSARRRDERDGPLQPLARVGDERDLLPQAQARHDRLVDVHVGPRVIQIGDDDERRARRDDSPASMSFDVTMPATGDRRTASPGFSGATRSRPRRPTRGRARRRFPPAARPPSARDQRFGGRARTVLAPPSRAPPPPRDASRHRRAACASRHSTCSSASKR